MGPALLSLGVAMHAVLLVTFGTYPGAGWLQVTFLAGTGCLAAVVVGVRRRLTPRFWTVVAVVSTPLVATVAPFYPEASLVVLPVVFLLVVFTSMVLARRVARIVAAEGLVAATFVIVHAHAADRGVAAELFFVIGVLGVIHLLVVRAVDAQTELFDQLARRAHTDDLTGVLSRRAFEDLLDDELAAGRTTSLVVVDVDRFKLINDTYGHPAGDAALQHIAAGLAAGVRGSDAVTGRLGGDEFAILLRSCPADRAQRRCEDLVQVIAAAPLTLPDGGAVELAVSIGVATADRGDARSLYGAADAALYTAKVSGRGRVAAHADRPGPSGPSRSAEQITG